MTIGEMQPMLASINLDHYKVEEIRITPERIEVIFNEPYGSVAAPEGGKYKYACLNGKTTLHRLS